MANLLLEREKLTQDNDNLQSKESLGSFNSFQRRRLPRFTISTEMSILGELATASTSSTTAKAEDDKE